MQLRQCAKSQYVLVVIMVNNNALLPSPFHPTLIPRRRPLPRLTKLDSSRYIRQKIYKQARKK